MAMYAIKNGISWECSASPFPLEVKHCYIILKLVYG